ncbi:hypothetical protein ACHAXA_000523 [Cyclostephanos tholiformis]|uniref:Uncharacterized protein n=1 Tax=Cyclostephanos tholiformis TaxID=382380 RepID=A0ABD3STG6_9STRA
MSQPTPPPRKIRTDRSRLPTGTLGKDGFQKDRQKSVLGPSCKDNSRPDDNSRKARQAKPQLETAEDDVPPYEYYSEILRNEMELRLNKSTLEMKSKLAAKYQREVDEAVATKLKHAVSAAQREMDAKFETLVRDTKARLNADFRRYVDEGVSETHNIARFPSYEGVNIVSGLSKLGEKWTIILVVKPSRSPHRSISNPNVGDPNRAFLGENGLLMVHENIVTKVRRAVYYDGRGNVKFMAECPPAKNPYQSIQGNAGKEPLLVWDAVNEAHASGGTTIKGANGVRQPPAYRRFFFHFTSNASLAVALHHIMYDNQRLTDEFFHPNPERNRFLKELNLPAHNIVSTASSAIDVNSSRIRRTPVNAQKLTRKYDGVDPTLESQAK